jgi:hypothetical protein
MKVLPNDKEPRCVGVKQKLNGVNLQQIVINRATNKNGENQYQTSFCD